MLIIQEQKTLVLAFFLFILFYLFFIFLFRSVDHPEAEHVGFVEICADVARTWPSGVLSSAEGFRMVKSSNKKEK